LDELQDHLEKDCKAIAVRAGLIARSKKRRELMQCIACGQMIPLIDLSKHEVVTELKIGLNFFNTLIFLY
jgi:hypothetical protein